MKPWPVLTLALAACGDGPDREQHAAIPPDSVPRGTTERLANLAAPGPPVTSTLLAVGRDSYGGYCAPCHGKKGLGDGPVVEKGFPRPPALLRTTRSPERIVAIIGTGTGMMPPLAGQVPPRRRWAIAPDRQHTRLNSRH